jgi:phosphonate transport system substrate-binding protein
MLRRSFLALSLLSLTGHALAEEVLRVSAIPDEAPTELQRKFAPLGKYLEAETGMKVSSCRSPTTPPWLKR